ncbi:MAG: hypothetical protein ACRDRX_16275 [Pseudonocardiaceae bacterium]
MIREDRELLTELARLNREMAPLALRMMDGSASAAEQQQYARRLTDAGERLRLLGERLREVNRSAQHQQAERARKGLAPDESTEMMLRLAGLALALTERHATDLRGRCQVPGCSLQRRVPWRKWRSCPVFITALFWVEQPLGIARQAEPK